MSATDHVQPSTCLLVHGLLSLSTVPSSLRCIESIRPSVLVKRSCKLCRLYYFFCRAQCLTSSVRGHDQLQGTWIGCSHSVAPTCSSPFHLDCLARVQQTPFFLKHYSPIPWRRAQDVGFAWALQRLNRIRMWEAFACGKIQLARSQKCSVKCVHHSP